MTCRAAIWPGNKRAVPLGQAGTTVLVPSLQAKQRTPYGSLDICFTRGTFIAPAEFSSPLCLIASPLPIYFTTQMWHLHPTGSPRPVSLPHSPFSDLVPITMRNGPYSSETKRHFACFAHLCSRWYWQQLRVFLPKVAVCFSILCLISHYGLLCRKQQK